MSYYQEIIREAAAAAMNPKDKRLAHHYIAECPEPSRYQKEGLIAVVPDPTRQKFPLLAAEFNNAQTFSSQEHYLAIAETEYPQSLLQRETQLPLGQQLTLQMEQEELNFDVAQAMADNLPFVVATIVHRDLFSYAYLMELVCPTSMRPSLAWKFLTIRVQMALTAENR
jgi:hypothetical protein